MRDYWHDITNWLDHNRGLFAAALLASAAAVYLLGCEATVDSLVAPGRQVNRPQLIAEIHKLDDDLTQRRQHLEAQLADFNLDIEAFNRNADAAIETLEAREQFRTHIINTLGGFAIQAAEGAFNPISALTTLVGILGAATAIGVGYDNRRKNQVIERLKAEG